MALLFVLSTVLCSCVGSESLMEERRRCFLFSSMFPQLSHFNFELSCHPLNLVHLEALNFLSAVSRPIVLTLVRL